MPDLMFLDFIELFKGKLLSIKQTKFLAKITCLGERTFAVMFLYKSVEAQTSVSVCVRAVYFVFLKYLLIKS